MTQPPELHQSLLKLRHEATALIDSIAESNSQAHVNGVHRQMKEIMSQMRSNIRDLELASEEQDP